MATIGEMLIELAEVKQDLKTSITAKGQTVGDDFTAYADAVDNISTGGGGSKPSKILVVLTPTGTITQENNIGRCDTSGDILYFDSITYWEDTSNNGSLMRVVYDDTYYSTGHGDPSTRTTVYKYNDVSYNTMQDAVDIIYGSGNAIATDLNNYDLAVYIDTLQQTYDLTLVKWRGEWYYETNIYDDSKCSAAYIAGYEAGYNDYPDYNTTHNPYGDPGCDYDCPLPDEDDNFMNWRNGYDEGFNAPHE